MGNLASAVSPDLRPMNSQQRHLCREYLPMRDLYEQPILVTSGFGLPYAFLKVCFCIY